MAKRPTKQEKEKQVAKLKKKVDKKKDVAGVDQKEIKKLSKATTAADEKQRIIEKLTENVRKKHNKFDKKHKKSNTQKTKDLATLDFMYRQCLDMLKLAELAMIQSGGTKGIHGYVMLGNMTREIANDKRALEDNEKHIQFFQDNVVDTAITIISQQTLNVLSAVKTVLKEELPAKKAALAIDKVNDMTLGLSSLYDEVSSSSYEKIKEYLDG